MLAATDFFFWLSIFIALFLMLRHRCSYLVVCMFCMFSVSDHSIQINLSVLCWRFPAAGHQPTFLHGAGETRGWCHPAVPPAGRLRHHGGPLHPELVQEGSRTGSSAASVLQVHQQLQHEVRHRCRSREGLSCGGRLAAAARLAAQRLGGLLLQQESRRRAAEGPLRTVMSSCVTCPRRTGPSSNCLCWSYTWSLNLSVLGLSPVRCHDLQ